MNNPKIVVAMPLMAMMLISTSSLQATPYDAGPGWQAPPGQQQSMLDPDMFGHWKSIQFESQDDMMIRSSSSMVLRPNGSYSSFGGGGYFTRDENGGVSGGGRGGSERGRWAVRDGQFYLMPEGENQWVHKGYVEKDVDQIAVISPDGSHTVWYRKREQQPQRPQRPTRPW